MLESVRKINTVTNTIKNNDSNQLDIESNNYDELKFMNRISKLNSSQITYNKKNKESGKFSSRKESSKQAITLGGLGNIQ